MLSNPSPLVLLLLPLVDKAAAASIKVAIVGAGAGGSSAAFWLSFAKQRAAPGTTIDVTVYEQNSYVGGRSTTVYPYGDTTYAPIELGASIFATGNRNMMRAVDEFKLERVQFTGATPGTGVWDGTKFVYRSDQDPDGTVFDERYADGPVVSGRLIAQFLAPYSASYSSYDPFTTVSEYSESLGYLPLQATSTKSYFSQNGVNGNWTNEFMTATIRFNYGQDIGAIQGVAGLASLSAGTAYSVKTGNFKIFEEFLSRGNANVKLNTKVTSIKKLPGQSSRYTVQTSKGSATYDAIIVAAPLPLSGIALKNTAQPSSFPKVDYVHLHVTLLATTTPALLPAYFKTPSNSSSIPGTIITTAEYGTQPEFNSIRYQAKIQRNGQTEYIVKIFSKTKMTDAKLATLFGKGKIGWTYRKEWDAYPYFPPRNDFPPIKVDQGLYYVNSMEPLWSTMETEIISSRNVVDLLSKELVGSGLCGPGGAQGPVTESYVIGWDC